MNDLGIAVVWLVVQVTAVALASLGVSAIAARRAPGAGAVAAVAGLAATVALGFIACCPLPAWWAWDAAILPGDGAKLASPDLAQGPAVPAAASGDEHGIGLSELVAAMRALGRTSVNAQAADDPKPAWPPIVAGVAMAAMAFGMLRLLLGLWALRRVARRSQPAQDQDLLSLVDELRAAMDVGRPVVVRETSEVATAATFGWWAPVLLISPGWRQWSAEERRAAIAHELAHVRRADFAAWLLARLSVALYVWHPLVRCLAGRLQLQQELAADAAAAAQAGGRPAYLRALAALALYGQDRAQPWPAPAFLSDKGTLLRRIAMLKVKDNAPRPVLQISRRLSLTVLLAVGLIASAWRFPLRDALAAGPPGSTQPAETAVAPFDLSLLATADDRKTDGYYAFRPAALLKRPVAAPVAKLINKHIDEMTEAVSKDGFGVHIEDVEQVMGRVSFAGENKPGKRQLVASMNVLVTTRDIDWAKLRDQCGDLMKPHRYHGQTYVSFTLPDALKGMIGGDKPGYLWAVDARTLLFETDAAIIKAQIDLRAGGKQPPQPDCVPGWDLVSRGLVALAFDNREGRIVKRSMTEEEKKEYLSDPSSVEHHGAQFCLRAERVVLGFAGNDDFRCDLRASAATPEAAEELARTCKALVAAGRTAGAAARAAKDGDEPVLESFLGRVTKSATVRRDGSVVTMHAETDSGFNAVISTYLKELPSDKE